MGLERAKCRKLIHAPTQIDLDLRLGLVTVFNITENQHQNFVQKVAQPMQAKSTIIKVQGRLSKKDREEC